MRHHNANRKFGRPRNQRKALLRSLAVALITHGRIQTTEAKAKELRPYVEKMVTKSKKDTLANRRQIEKEFSNGQKTVILEKLFGELGPRYEDRSGGYTRITKLSGYSDDARKKAQIEFV